jgi:hypothetical protein
MDDNFKQVDDHAVITDSYPKIYSRKAILGFSLFFSAIFGAVLLMQNLKDIGKKKEANIILLLSVIYTAITIYIVNIPEKPNSSLTFICNIVGGVILTEYFYKKSFPNDLAIEKKKIWKPLIISILITIPLVLAMIYSM